MIDKIKEIRETFKENEWCYRVSEENVRAEIIDPILRILGWRLPYIKREEHGMDDMISMKQKDGHFTRHSAAFWQGGVLFLPHKIKTEIINI